MGWLRAGGVHIEESSGRKHPSLIYNTDVKYT